jgi:hypothetical protein
VIETIRDHTHKISRDRYVPSPQQILMHKMK